MSGKGLTYLPESVKKELADIEISEDVQPTEEDVIITEVTKKTETVKYIPTKVPGIENFVLVQAPKTKSTAKRSSVAGPVAKSLEDPTKFYCDKCPYFKPDQMNWLITRKRIVLKKIQTTFVMHVIEDSSMKIPYVNTITMNMDIILWHCKKCNEGFHYKSNRSKHRHACPNKNGPDTYLGCAPYDEVLEETFKPKTAIAVKIPTEVQVDDEPQEEGENVGQPQPQPQVLDQAQLQVGETERAVASLGETGSDILNRLAEGESFGSVIDDEDDQSKVVKKEEMEIEMTFED